MMLLNPPLKRNAVEVTSVDTQIHTISLIIHVTGNIENLKSINGQGKITDAMVGMINYMETEGFIKKGKNCWLTRIGIVLHSIGSKNNTIDLTSYE